MFFKKIIILVLLILITCATASATSDPYFVTMSKVTEIEYRTEGTNKTFLLSGYTSKNVIHNLYGSLSNTTNASCVELASKLNLSSLSSSAKLQITFGGSSQGGGGQIGGPKEVDFSKVVISNCRLIIK